MWLMFNNVTWVWKNVCKILSMLEKDLFLYRMFLSDCWSLRLGAAVCVKKRLQDGKANSTDLDKHSLFLPAFMSRHCLPSHVKCVCLLVNIYRLHFCVNEDRVCCWPSLYVSELQTCFCNKWLNYWASDTKRLFWEKSCKPLQNCGGRVGLTEMAKVICFPKNKYREIRVKCEMKDFTKRFNPWSSLLLCKCSPRWKINSS